MATYTETLALINQQIDQGLTPAQAINAVRKDSISNFHKLRKRNVICYYSGWVQGGNGGALYSINDDDMNSFMAAVHQMDVKKGLDLVLHTPGGGVAATQAIVTYLRKLFKDDIEVFVPHIAMSCGTMIACASKLIHLCKHSSLGPVDPQFSGIPVQEIIAEFQKAYQEIQADPSATNYWSILLSKYPPAILAQAQNTNSWAVTAVEKWLEEVMFVKDPNPMQQAKNVISKISSTQITKTHDKHIMIDEARSMGLLINDVEADQALQDHLLGLHYAFVVTFGNTQAVKIVENHLGFDRVTMAT